MAFVYVLYNEEVERFYIGSTRDMAKRIKDHWAGRVRSTKAYRPWKIVHTEEYESYSDARKRENFLKSGVGRKWLKKNVIV